MMDEGSELNNDDLDDMLSSCTKDQHQFVSSQEKAPNYQ
jgi:hypothetical protein